MRLTISRFRFAFSVLVCFSFVVAANAELKAQGKGKKAQTEVKPVQKLPSLRPITAPPILQPSTLESDKDSVKTAEQLLARIDSPDETLRFRSTQGSELSEEEVGRAVKVLRERYPIVSLRDRLGEHATPPKPAIEPEPIGKSVVAKGKATEPRLPIVYESQRTRALRKLHSEEVHDFINSPGFGFGRMRQPDPSPYDLRGLRGYATVRLSTQPIDSEIRDESPVELQDVVPLKPDSPWQEIAKARFTLSQSGMPTPAMANQFHSTTSQLFAGSFSTGLVKSVDEVAGFEAHRARFAEDWTPSITLAPREQVERFFEGSDEQASVQFNWKLNRMQLVSLLLHDEPQVYVSDNLPNMEELSGADVDTRGLDPFETDALARMGEGEDVITRATPNRLQMMGAMRATENCMQCHAVKENELLGAFSYEFLRDPKLNLKARDY